MKLDHYLFCCGAIAAGCALYFQDILKALGAAIIIVVIIAALDGIKQG